MFRNAVIAVLVAGLLAAPGSTADRVQLAPGVTYEKTVRLNRRGPVVVHVVSAPRPTGGYALEPLLSNGTVAGREKLTAIERRAGQGTSEVVGVNGDNTAPDGRPDGIVMQNGVLAYAPISTRSSLGIDADGNLRPTRVTLVPRWNGTGQRRPLVGLNRAPGRNGVTLYTPAWGAATPATPGTTEIRLTGFPPAQPNVDLTGQVAEVRAGGRTPIPPDGAVLVGRGNGARFLTAEAPVGTTVTVRLTLNPDWTGIVDAIGGGPLLVRQGKAVFNAGESFAPASLGVRQARSAIGQRANGTIVFVVADGGRPGYSIGLTNYDLARELVRQKAVTGYALAPGALSTLAADGKLLSRPSDRKLGERGLADALVLVYRGASATR